MFRPGISDQCSIPLPSARQKLALQLSARLKGRRRVILHTEMGEQEEENNAIAPCDVRGDQGALARPRKRPPAPDRDRAPKRWCRASAVTGVKNKETEARVKTPARRLSRLLTAFPLSPDHTEAASPTKKTTGP